MNDRSPKSRDPGRNHLLPGMPVYDNAGEMVGTLDAESRERDYLIVRQSASAAHDVYVPPRAIARIEPDGVYLTLTHRTLRGKRYATPPQAETEAAQSSEAPVAAEVAPTQRASVSPRSDTGTARTTAPVTPERDSKVSVPLVREDLSARRTPTQMGTVHLHKSVETEEKEIAVPITHDEVIVEHIPPEQLDANAAVGTNELLIPIMEEQVVVQKRMVVKEYVRVRKRQVVEQRQVREPVRREVLSVQEQPSAETGRPEWPLMREMQGPSAEHTLGTDANASLRS